MNRNHLLHRLEHSDYYLGQQYWHLFRASFSSHSLYSLWWYWRCWRCWVCWQSRQLTDLLCVLSKEYPVAMIDVPSRWHRGKRKKMRRKKMRRKMKRKKKREVLMARSPVLWGSPSFDGISHMRNSLWDCRTAEHYPGTSLPSLDAIVWYLPHGRCEESHCECRWRIRRD